MPTAPTDAIDDVLAVLSVETPEALRGERLPLLFQCATACGEEHAPQVVILVERAFAGEAGLAALRQQHAFLGQGVAHADPNVRAASLSQLRRLCASADDVTLLREHALLASVGAAVGDAELFVARHAMQALVTCAASGVAPLRVLLEDGATLGVLGGLGSGAGGPGPGARQAAVLRLTLALALALALALTLSLSLSLSPTLTLSLTLTLTQSSATGSRCARPT